MQDSLAGQKHIQETIGSNGEHSQQKYVKVQKILGTMIRPAHLKLIDLHNFHTLLNFKI